MADTTTRQRALPASLRPEHLMRMPLLCRFGWHQWVWGKVGPIFQDKTCTKCGRSKICVR